MADEKSFILLVDDDAEDLASLEQALGSLGCDLVSMKDPHDVIPGVHRLRPDVVILDALLPGLSGFDLCKQIKTDPELKTTQVIIVTGVYLRQQYRKEALQQFKADAFLTKPFRPPELQRHAVQLLSRKARTPPASFLKRVGLAPSASPGKRGLLDRLLGRSDAEGPPARIAPVAREKPGPPLKGSEGAETAATGTRRSRTPSETEASPLPAELVTPEAPAADVVAPEDSAGPPSARSERDEEPSELLPPPPQEPERDLVSFEVAPPVGPDAPESLPSDEAPEPEPMTATTAFDEESVDSAIDSYLGEAEPEDDELELSASEELEAPPPPEIGSVRWTLADAGKEEPSRPDEATPPSSTATEADERVGEPDRATNEMEAERSHGVEPAAPGAAALPVLEANGAAEAAAQESSPAPEPQTEAPAQPVRKPRFRIGEVPVFEEEDFFTEFKRELSKCRRVDRPLTLILIRVGDLNQIVELFGRDYRESVLWHLAEQAMASLREVDLVGMMSSKNLVALTAFASDRYGGGRIVARMRGAVAKSPFRVGQELPPIVPVLDFGLATFPDDGNEVAALLKRAEEDLFARAEASSASRRDSSSD